MRAVEGLALALCAALMLRVRPAHCQHREHYPVIEHTNSQCYWPPRIGVINDPQFDFVHYADFNNILRESHNVGYGASVAVWCQSQARDTRTTPLVITRNGTNLTTEKIGRSVIWSTKNMYLQLSAYAYTCIDVESNCARSLTIVVTPKLAVVSPDLQPYYEDIYQFHFNYTIDYGKSFWMFCSSPDAARLVISKDGERLPTERENGTLIKYFIWKPDLQISKYVCTDIDTNSNSSVFIRVVPTIYFQTSNESITPYYSKFSDHHVYRYLKYEDAIEMYCSGPRRVKLTDFIGYGENDNFTVNFNQTTVKFGKKITLGIWYVSCSDFEVPEHFNKVAVRVEPRVEVFSPNIRLTESSGNVNKYSIKYGDPLEIVCSGPDASRLNISARFTHDGIKETLNNTSIKYLRKEHGMDEKKYYTCKEIDSEDSIHYQALIEVSVLPVDVTDFRCVSRVRYINCTWSATSGNGKFVLFYVDNGFLTRICEKYRGIVVGKPPLNRIQQFCVKSDWYDGDTVIMYSDIFNLVLESCNGAGCINQTFHIDHLSIVTPDPPKRLKAVNKTSRGAVLQWDSTVIYCANEYLYADRGAFHHKLQYWYHGIESQDVNSSLVTCDCKHCQIELNLPCPGQIYEVSVYQKLKRAIGEEFWSVPSVVTFYTDSKNDETNMLDPTCSQGPVKTKEVMRYFVQKLREEMLHEIQPMKQEARSLQDKLKSIYKTYLPSTKEQDSQ